MITLHDRYLGTLVGVLAGDALGAPYEATWTSDDIRADFAARGGLVPFSYPDPWGKDGDFPAGRPTDDSELTAALAESLVECNGIDLEDQYRRFKRAALSGESFLWDGVVKGFGRTTRKTLAAENYRESLLLPNLPLVPSNGSLMRSAPLALFFHGAESEKMFNATRSSSYVTHRHEAAMECCTIFVDILDTLLRGACPQDAVSSAVYGTDVDNWLVGDVFKDLNETPDIPPNFPHRGGAVLTLHVALWGLLTASSFKEGITEIVALGGDTDTYAAVAGALLGATYGVEAIPEEWTSVLKGRERMQELASLLFERHREA